MTEMTATGSTSAPSGLRIWFMASRPKTLPAGLSPVLVGTALADNHETFHLLRFLAALVGALLIQVGANLSNDYSDARRGADTDDRLGPVRVTAGGLVPPRQVLIAVYVTFGLAVLVGIYLIVAAGWQLLLVGVASIAAGVLYTGGPRPYGYEGLGEVFVFLFFGLVAVAGSYFVQTKHVDWQSVALAAAVGFLPTAILVVNNTRDIDTDRRANKKTLAVRMGRQNSRRFYAALIAAAYVGLIIVMIAASMSAWLLLVLLSLPLAARLVRTMATKTDGPTLNGLLAGTGQLQLVYCVLLSAGLLISR
jgi:1,4-dihydroxy-2-naphthoate octaprenyltransferase